MKVSIYTFFFRSNSKYYIYNTLSNALLSIGENIYIGLQHARETGHTLEENSIDPDLWKILKNKYFITENQKDDFLSPEVTKRVYFIGNERMLIAHDSNRLRFS